ncbi:BgTH12-01230, partial [Blumeria graminis f. sp. triticale]
QIHTLRDINSHSFALKLVQHNEIDILLVQEPWNLRDLATRQSISHPNFMCFSSLSERHSRPRALIYVRKSHELDPCQTAVDITFNCVQIAVEGGRGSKIIIWSIYSPLANCTGAGDGLNLV